MPFDKGKDWFWKVMGDNKFSGLMFRLLYPDFRIMFSADFTFSPAMILWFFYYSTYKKTHEYYDKLFHFILFYAMNYFAYFIFMVINNIPVNTFIWPLSRG